MFLALGREAPAAEARTWCIGPPLLESFHRLLDGDDRLAVRALGHYRERFGEIGLYENRVDPGIEDALSTLRARGANLYVATSEPTVYAWRIVQHFGLDRWIDRVFGSDLDGTRAAKPDLSGVTACVPSSPRSCSNLSGGNTTKVANAAPDILRQLMQWQLATYSGVPSAR